VIADKASEPQRLGLPAPQHGSDLMSAAKPRRPATFKLACTEWRSNAAHEANNSCCNEPLGGGGNPSVLQGTVVGLTLLADQISFAVKGQPHV
jgi:hypothetical protein